MPTFKRFNQREIAAERASRFAGAVLRGSAKRGRKIVIDAETQIAINASRLAGARSIDGDVIDSGAARYSFPAPAQNWSR